MRLPPAALDPLANPVAGLATLDEVLAQNAARDPDGLALVAPGLPFAGTWREADRAASALADTFAAWDLEPDAVVGVQLGASAEAALACLALWRAGMIPALLPLAWRRREVEAALRASHAQATIAWTEAAGARLAEAACEAAFGLDRLRFVATFGQDAPDGATPLDDLLSAPSGAFVRPNRPDDAADHVAVVTFDAGATPIARSHNELVALGLGPLLAARIGGGDRLLATLDVAGLPGLATGLVPWLVTRATGCFHQPSTTEALAGAARELGATHVTLPGRALERLVADGVFDDVALTAVLATWRAPDPRHAATAAACPGAAMVDVLAFGELGLVAAARATPGRALVPPLGPYAPEGLEPLIDTRVTLDGRVLARGCVCPAAPFPSDEGARVAIDPEGFVDTGLAGVADRSARRIAVGGRRRNVVQVGGVGVAREDAEQAFAEVGLAGAVELQEDALLGARVRLALPPGAHPVSAEDAAERLAEAGFGGALAPRTVVAERARKTA